MFLLLPFPIMRAVETRGSSKDLYYQFTWIWAIEQDADIVSFLYRQNIIKLTNGMMKLHQQQDKPKSWLQNTVMVV
jgi:hypothetical protein